MRKIIKKILFFLLLVVLAIQVPFIYRRYKIGKLAGAVEQLNAGRIAREQNGFREFAGVMHVHSSLGGHSTGSFTELIKAAKSNELDFVVMTEHFDLDYDTSALTLNGKYGNTLFVNGQEIDANDGGRYLLLPGTPDAVQLAKLDSKALLEKVHSEGRVAINNYPERKTSDDDSADGMEVYSLHINGKRSNPFAAAFDLLWSFRAYPEMTYATYLRRNNDYMQRYDAIASEKRFALTGGADAHSNKGYYLVADDEGHRFFGFKIDDYATVFRLVRMHALINTGQQLTRETLIDAIKQGHTFIGFDVIGDTKGFIFSADNGTEQRIMGDEIALANGVKLSAAAPNNVRFLLFRNGQMMQEFSGGYEFNINIAEKGVYRVEAYLNQLGTPFDKTPWIVSNPIYVR